MMKQVQRLRPGAPISLTAGATGTTTQELSWTAASFAGGSAITGYNVYFRVSGSGPYVLFDDTASTSITVTDLESGETYDFIVKTTNAFGESTPSNVVTQQTEVE